MAFEILCALSSNAHAELCLRYWACDDDGVWQESLTSLCDAFDLTAESLEKRVSDNSVAYALKMRCKCCGMPDFAVTRAQYERLARFTSRFARSCANVKCELTRNPLDLMRTLDSINKRADIIEEKLHALRSELHAVDYSSFEAIDAFYLYCLLIVSEGHWSDYELPANDTLSAKLAPTHLLTQQVYEHLRRLAVIVPSVHSPMRSFNIAGGKNSPITFDPLRVSWTLAADTGGHVKDQLVALLRSIIQSACESSRKELRKTLVEHECLNLLSSKLAKINIQMVPSTEAQLRSALEPMLRNLPAKAAMLIINEIFVDQRFWSKLKNAETGKVVSATVAKLEKYANEMPQFKFNSDTSKPLNDKILAKGDSLMSNIFCQLLSAELWQSPSD